MGLLSKASFISDDNVKFAFSEFVLKYNVKTFAVFVLNNGYYSIGNSIGFDGSSLITSLSTKDFWDGVCAKFNKTYSFSTTDKTLNPILQFFSFEIRDDINSISIYRTEDKIFMLCNKDFNNELIEDMLHIDSSIDYVNLNLFNKDITKDSKVFLYEIDFTEALETYFAMKQKNEDKDDLLKKALYNELVNRFSCYFAKYGVKRISESSIRILLNVDKSIHEEHLICHIVYTLQEVIEAASELINFENKGIATSLIELKDFIQAE